MSFLYKGGAGLNWRPGKFQVARFSAMGHVLLEPVAQLCQLCGAREGGRDSAAFQGSQDMPPCAQMVLPEDTYSLVATKHFSFPLSPFAWRVMFPWCQHALMRRNASCCVVWLRRHGTYSIARSPCKLRALCSCTWEWRDFLVQTSPQCNKLLRGLLRARKLLKNVLRIWIPLGCNGFPQQKWQKQFIPDRVVSSTGHVGVLQANAQLAYFTDCHKCCF